jgi:TolB-like protein/DNA-binding winged helix-turn-helix (wHTH) protein/Flp pilus assembly protein TadD
VASLRFGVFELDLREGELRREGLPVKLQPQPVKVLALLAQNGGRTVTRDELKAEVWGDSTFVDFDRGLNFCVLQIRTALGDDADNPRFVQTVPRKGYRFIAPVERANGDAPAAPPPAVAAPVPQEIATLVPRAAIALGLVALLFVAALLLSRRGRPDVAAPARPARVMLAVLPIENLSGDPAQAFFADGLTEELITHLGRSDPEGLGVIARTSVLKYRGARDTDIARISRELGVSHVLEGSVRKDNERVRVTAQLIRASDQTHVWAESYDRLFTEALSLQDEVARRVAASLQAKLLPSAPPRSRPSTLHPRAYEAYLEGRALASERKADALQRALALFDEARTLDPQYAAAHAAAADALFQLSMRGRPPREVLPLARAAAEQALQLDPESAEALAVLGGAKLWHAWDPEAALQLLQRALRANASFAPAHHDLAWVYLAKQRPDDAVAAIRRAQELDPLSPRATIDVGWVLLRARRYQDAVAQANKTLQLAPGMSEATACLAEGLLALGQGREALDLIRRMLKEAGAPETELRRLDGPDTRAALRAAGEWRLQRMLKRPGGPASWHNVAMEQVLLGRKDDALASLEQALLAHEMVMVVFDSLPAFDVLRSEPRFQALLAKVRAKSS